MKNLKKTILLLFISICCGVNVAYSQTRATLREKRIIATREIFTKSLINDSDQLKTMSFNDVWDVKLETVIHIWDQSKNGLIVSKPSNLYASLNLEYRDEFGFHDWYDFGIINHNYFATWNESKKTNATYFINVEPRTMVTFTVNSQDMFLKYDVTDGYFHNSFINETITNIKHFTSNVKRVPLPRRLEEVPNTCTECPRLYQDEQNSKLPFFNEYRRAASKYAPELRFSNITQELPDYADKAFANRSLFPLKGDICDKTSMITSNASDAYHHFPISINRKLELYNRNVPTYYLIKKVNNRIFIDYWWFYYRQRNCFLNSGGHDFDWEHATVQLEHKGGDNFKPISVTYFQHGGWLTKNFSENEIDITNGTHPAVYVGHLGHGSYHKEDNNQWNPAGFCTYYGDDRTYISNETNTNHLRHSTERNLIPFNCSMSWVSYRGMWGRKAEAPMVQVKDYAVLPACRGNAPGTSREEKSGCLQSTYKDIVQLKSVGTTNPRMESENFEEAEESAFPENGTELTGVTTAFPNPVKDILNLTNVSSTATISIMDVNGKEVMNAIGQSQLNIGSLDAGMYFVRVNGDKPIKITKE